MHEAAKLTRNVADTLAGLHETCGLAADGLMNLFIDAQFTSNPDVAVFRLQLQTFAQQLAGIRDLVEMISREAATAAAATKEALQ